MPATRSPLLARADQFGRLVENVLLVGFLFGLIGVASTQILLRNAFSLGISWADGLARLAVLWLALLGAVAASRDGRNISINLAGRWLPERFRRPVNAVVDLFTAVAACAFAWYSWRFVADSRAYGDLVLDGAPAWIFQLVMPVAFALIAWRYLLRCAGHIRGSL